MANKRLTLDQFHAYLGAKGYTVPPESGVVLDLYHLYQSGEWGQIVQTEFGPTWEFQATAKALLAPFAVVEGRSAAPRWLVVGESDDQEEPGTLVFLVRAPDRYEAQIKAEAEIKEMGIAVGQLRVTPLGQHWRTPTLYYLGFFPKGRPNGDQR